ncbi:hypothetical protein XELAEV_18028000mg [Xenopus laevis]|uniref:Uncharacterized protein n=1 Tax=Xenopus laevis TaxID=8355 RepID=A0A974CXC1_XENLA|nr:hypothetical protein XELAEV_18028000mg [Xenopus laevis]
MNKLRGAAMLVVVLLVLPAGHCKERTDSRNLTEKNLMNIIVRLIKEVKVYRLQEGNGKQHLARKEDYSLDVRENPVPDYGYYPDEQRVVGDSNANGLLPHKYGSPLIEEQEGLLCDGSPYSAWGCIQAVVAMPYDDFNRETFGIGKADGYSFRCLIVVSANPFLKGKGGDPQTGGEEERIKERKSQKIEGSRRLEKNKKERRPERSRGAAVSHRVRERSVKVDHDLAEIFPRDLRMKDKFLKHLTGKGRLSFNSPSCNKLFRRLYNTTKDCTTPARMLKAFFPNLTKLKALR